MPDSLVDTIRSLGGEWRTFKLPARQSVFDDLLERYNDACATIFRGDERGAGEGPSGTTPIEWNWTYEGLEQMLRSYRTMTRVPDGRSGYWHLSEWYLRAKRYPQWPKKRLVQRGRESVEFQPPVQWKIVRHPDIEPLLVLVGLETLDKLWDDQIAPRHEGAEPDNPWEIINRKRRGLTSTPVVIQSISV